MKRASLLLLLLVLAAPAADARRRAATPPKGCPELRPAQFFISYQGLVSGCSPASGGCLPGETIEFAVRSFGYPAQCDAHVVRIAFGDGSVAHAALSGAVSHVYFAYGIYTVTADVANRQNTVRIEQRVTTTGAVP